MSESRRSPFFGPTPYVGRALVRHAERAMHRASDSPLVRGNEARLLIDGTVAFPEWLAQIASAERYIHLENYIVRDDRTGRRFQEALAERAQAGVSVRVLYDWVGCWATPNRFWSVLRDAGADVRPFGRPGGAGPNIFHRNHRKVLVVDGRYAAVSGMCIGEEWAGDPEAGIPAWRDTGVALRGPVVAAIDRAFRSTWALAGDPLPDEVEADTDEPAGRVGVRVVEGEPGKSRIYRLSQLVTVGVERRLWITDPYFVAPPAMVETLAAAARDGVDVRIILPAYNNWPVTGGMSRAGYRPLLEAGVRLFEWEGPMIHAKTTVADGVWSRVGSSNLNLASLIGNWELDVAIVDRSFGREMEELFTRDTGAAVELNLPTRTGWDGGRSGDRRAIRREPLGQAAPGRPPDPEEVRARREMARRGSQMGRLVARVSRAGSVLGQTILGYGRVGQEDREWIVGIGLMICIVAALGIWLPRLLAWPVALFLFLVGVAAVVRGITGGDAPPPPEANAGNRESGSG